MGTCSGGQFKQGITRSRFNEYKKIQTKPTDRIDSTSEGRSEESFLGIDKGIRIEPRLSVHGPTPSKKIGSVSLADETSAVRLPPSRFLRVDGLFWLPFRLGLVPFLKILWILNQNESHAKKITLGEPYFYLFHLAVDPEVQGRGLGSTLIHSVTKRADHENTPCFLETDKRSNIPLYEKHGFAVHAELRINTNLSIWYMLRAPQTDLS